MTCVKQWLTASVFLMSIAFAMAELASAAPTSGGVRGLLFTWQWQPFLKFSALLLDLYVF
jgi:hypothetical protein